MKGLLSRREALPAALLMIAFGAGIIESPYFLDLRYLLDASSLYVEGGLMVLGMTFVIITGNIDLSVASNMALTACIGAKLLDAGLPIVAGVAAMAMLGSMLGLVNGFLIAYGRLPSFLVTLATMALYRGSAQALLGSASAPTPDSFKGADLLLVPGIGIPLPLLILLVAAVALGLVLHRTVLGRWVFAIGSNEAASRCAGVPTSKVKVIIFGLSGFMAGIAAVLIASRLGVARYDHGRGLELDVITATVLGGTSIYGGSGSILGSLLAVLLIAVVRIGMGLANVTAEVQLTIVGALLIVSVGAALLAERLSSSRQAGSRTRSSE